MKHSGKSSLVGIVIVLLQLATPSVAAAAEKLGIFEMAYIADASFEETATMVEKALRESPLTLHGQHDIAVPDNVQRARIFLLTSPELIASSADEPPETISAQVLRVAVYTHGQSPGTLVNMANPVAHAMIFHAKSPNYVAIVEAAREATQHIRAALSGIPGKAVSEQMKPLRTENHYRKYKGDGPARMMTKFRTWKKSQLGIRESSSEDFSAVLDEISNRLRKEHASSVDDPAPWQLVSMIPLREDAVYFGITNRYTEDKMIRINSDYRNDDKTDAAPFPGVDHVTALPLDILVIKTGNKTKVIQYGQMWRMQLYFWDSGYRAFTKNTLIPGTISNSIDDWLSDQN